MEKYEFLLANYNEILEIIDLYHSLVGAEGCSWNLDYPDKETAENDVANGSLYVLKADDKIIAAVSAVDPDELMHLPWKPHKPCELARLCVAPYMQKRGIGEIILRNIIKIIKEKDYDGIVMLVGKTNFAALALYDNNGFEKCGEVNMYDIDFYCYQIKFI